MIERRIPTTKEN